MASFFLLTILPSFQSNELVIGSADVRTRFLPEAELPECARLSSRAAQSAEGSLEEALKESARMSEERQMQQAISVRIALFLLPVRLTIPLAFFSCSGAFLWNKLQLFRNSKIYNLHGDIVIFQESKRLKQDGGASTSSSTQVAASDNFTEQNVSDLMKFGFAREQCIAELRESGGDVTKATAALLAKSLKGPQGK